MGGDNLNGGGGHRRLGEKGGKHGGDNLECGGRMEMVGERGGSMGEII
jgi:hypothetical protein